GRRTGRRDAGTWRSAGGESPAFYGKAPASFPERTRTARPAVPRRAPCIRRMLPPTTRQGRIAPALPGPARVGATCSAAAVVARRGGHLGDDLAVDDRQALAGALVHADRA